LDQLTGGLYPGLYVLGAISSLGKTTFSHQLADQIAEAGHDVLFFSMEQSRLELATKSITRYMAREDLPGAVSSLRIRKGYLPEKVQAAVEGYKEAVADRMNIVEGNFDTDVGYIGDYIKRYAERNQCRPVVFVDYLQVLKPTEDKANRKQTTKEAIDAAVVELKRLSRDLSITIFVISSLNRTNYMTPVDFESFKESGGIEYTSDVLMGLQLSCLEEDLFSQDKKVKEKRKRINEAKAETPRKIQLICLKNRFGVSYFKDDFEYYPAAELFKESSIEKQSPTKRRGRVTKTL
jgi:replicative DNA helicase